jgi:hypothetical protein
MLHLLMPILILGGECCICPIPLGSVDCESLKTGIAEAYYTCSKNVINLAFAPDSNGCCDEAEITAFGLNLTVPTPLAEELLQPIVFVKQDDDTGAIHTFEDKSEGGNVLLEHTFTFQVAANTPDQECALNRMLGREVAILVKYKTGRWRFINYTGGMKVTLNSGNSNQSWKEVTVFGRVNDLPLYVSYTDAGVWADANLVPISVTPTGLINA